MGCGPAHGEGLHVRQALEQVVAHRGDGVALVAMVEQAGGYVCADAPKGGLRGGHIYLDIVSVGATMNILLAAVLCSGMTIIENCAKEPHIVDLANFLNAMGAQISGAGTDVIKVRGVKALHALHRAGVKVYSTDSATFADALEDLRQGNLRQAQPA